MPIPSVITLRLDLAIGASGLDVLTDFAQAKLKEASVVQIFMNRESVDVTAQVKVGDVEVMPQGPSAINATVGDVPLVPDDLIVNTIGNAGDQIQVLGTNVNAAAQEIGLIVKIVALEDALRMPSLVALT